MRHLGQSVLRLFKLNAIFWRYIVLPLLFSSRRTMTWPEAVRTMLGEMGGTWIKLGQMLALRFDLAPPEYCYEFFKLLNEVRPFPYEQARQIIIKELGKPPEELFAKFEREPFGAASIGQVHRAVLHSGEQVVVKVQRPNVRQVIRTDLRMMYFVGSILDNSGLLGATRSREVLNELASWTEEELDYLTEARHAQELKHNAGYDPEEQHPSIYTEYTTSRVLTMDEVKGIPLIDIMYALGEENSPLLNRLKQEGYDLEKIAINIMWNTMNQVYLHGYFHADLHPANLFVLPGNYIGYIDYGITGRLDTDTRESLGFYAHQLMQGRIERAADEFMRWLEPSEKTNMNAVRDELARVMDTYSLNIRDPEHARHGLSVLEAEVLNTIRRHGMSISPKIVTYMKVSMTGMTLIYELAPDFDVTRHQNSFFGRLMLNQARSMLDPRKSIPMLMEFRFRWGRAMDPREFSRSSNQQFEISLRRVRRRVQWMAGLSIGTGVVLYLYIQRPITRFLEHFFGHRLDWLPPTLAVIYAILTVAILWQARKLRARAAKRQTVNREAFRTRWQRPK